MKSTSKSVHRFIGDGVYQEDGSRLLLVCEQHLGERWCGDRSKVLIENRDGKVLWDYLENSTFDVVSVEIPVSRRTYMTVDLTPLDESILSHPDRTTPWNVSLSPKDAPRDRHPFNKHAELYEIGLFNFGEGRGILRDLVLNRLAPIIFIPPNVEACRSKRHTGKAILAAQDALRSPARRFDYEYRAWLNGGLCEVCHQRRIDLINKSRLAAEKEAKLSTGFPKISWDRRDV